MSSPSGSGSSPPIFPGNESGSTTSNSSNSNTSGGDGKSNYLWLLFLIPIVLLALGLGLTLWYVCRRRRIRRARRSALRNVTLVVQDEEKAREKEEKRLTRGDSVASKVLRRGSTLKEKREQRYSKRIARAVAQEAGVKEKVSGRYHEKLPSDASAQTTEGSATRAAVPLGRKASVKHRDREIAQRVWRIPGNEMGERPLSPRALTRDLEAAGALSSDGEDGVDSSAERKTDGYDSGKDLSDRELSDGEQQVPRSSIGGHIRPGTRRKDDANILSVIGESGLSQGEPSADVSLAEASPAISHPVAATTTEQTSVPAATAAAGLASAASLNRNVSQRSAYTTATSRSRYTTADETDNMSMRTAETSGTVVPAAHQQAEPASAIAPVLAGTTLTRHDSDQTDPFRSPDTAGTSSTHTNPFADSKRADVGTGAAPQTAVPAIVTTETSPPTTAGMELPSSSPTVPAAAAVGSTSLARKLSDVVRLKTPTPHRHRSPSPAASGSKRSMSISSKSSRGKAAQSATHDLSLHKTPSSPKAARLFRRIGESPSTSKPPGNGLHAGESWAYTSRASEWKRSSVPNVAGEKPTASETSGLAVPMPPFLSKTKRRSQSSTSLGNSPNSRSGSSSVSSDPPHVPGERVWLAPEAGTEELVATPVAAEDDGQSPTDTTGTPGLQRRPSVGVAGSRFKETFE